MKRSRAQQYLINTLVYSAMLPLVGGAVIRGLDRARQVMARFDSAYQGWGERSWLFQTLQDAWLEIDAMTRMELQRIHESLIENSPIVQKIRNLKIQFSVGPGGLKIIPESSDEGYNDARSTSWEKWWSNPDVGMGISGAQLTRVWAGVLFDKGEIFVNLTSGDSVQGLKSARVPKLQTIDAHRVKTPGGMAKDRETGFPVIDGKVINPATGRCMAFFVRKCDYNGVIFGSTSTSEEFDRVASFDPAKPDSGGIIHKFKIRRPGQLRGIPDGSCVFNMVRDNMDLHKLEMQSAKLCSSIGPVETNPTGELDVLQNRKNKILRQTQNAAGQAISVPSWADYNISLGSTKLALKVGSKLEDFMIRRPTPATQDYWDLHITFICIGYNTPKMLVMPYSLQGTVTRADLDICSAAFREDFEIIRELCETIYAWQGSWENRFNTNFTGAKYKASIQYSNSCINRERLARADQSRWVLDAKLPEDTQTCLIRPPRAPNVDIGYTAKALEIEMRLGVKNPQEFFADRGQDWRTQTRQMAEYIQYVQALEKEFNLQPGQITSLTTPQQIQDPTSRPDPPEGDTKETSPEAQRIGIVYE